MTKSTRLRSASSKLKCVLSLPKHVSICLWAGNVMLLVFVAPLTVSLKPCGLVVDFKKVGGEMFYGGGGGGGPGLLGIRTLRSKVPSKRVPSYS